MATTTLQERFALLRAKRPDITNADLARLTGARPPSVGDWFNGDTKSLKAETAARAAMAYGVNPVWLSTGIGPMDAHAQPEPRGALAANPLPLSLDNERRLTRLLAVLYQIPDQDRARALAAATETLLDHLPLPPT